MPRRMIPKALKLIRGNPGHRSLNYQEPPPPPGDLKFLPAPKHFAPDLQEIWKAELTNVSESHLKALDGVLFETYCVAIYLHRRAQAEFHQDPKLLGPVLRVLNQQAELIRKFSIELGLSAGSRSKVRVEPVAPDIDKWRELAKGSESGQKLKRMSKPGTARSANRGSLSTSAGPDRRPENRELEPT
jgi:phage terminase small subunit